MNGGYIMIDCKGLNLLATESQTIDGLYAESEAALATGKPVIANNCEYGEGVPMSPISCFAIAQGGEFCFSASILQIWVASNDSVRIVSLLDNAAKTTTKGK